MENPEWGVEGQGEGGGQVKTFKRICIKDWEITAENGDYFKVERGKEYITSAVNDAPKIGPKNEENCVIVFSSYWVPVPVDVFAGELQFT